MRKSAPIEVVVHYPKTKEGWDELGKRVTGCPLFAAVSAQNIQSQTDHQSHINAEHFSLAGIDVYKRQALLCAGHGSG